MKKLVFLLLICLQITLVFAQESVRFIQQEIVVDGVRPDFLSDLHMRPLQHVHKTNDLLPDFEADYFLGYTEDHLYIFIEYDGDSIVSRDRAYQNGDGFHFTMGFPQPGGADTDEFYVFGFSPSADWTNKMRWYYNVDLSMKRLGDDVLFETAIDNGKVGFELLIPWAAMPPYHPWFYDALGFNLCFVKAVEKQDKIYAFMETDPRMQSEQSLRKYIPLVFEEPVSGSGYSSMPDRHHFFAGDEALEMVLAGFTETNIKSTLTLEFFREGLLVHKQVTPVHLDEGFSVVSVLVESQHLKPGVYEFAVKLDDVNIGSHTVSVFEPFNPAAILEGLSGHKGTIDAGSHHTFSLQIDEVTRALEQLRPYESSSLLTDKMFSLMELVSKVEEGKDPIRNMRGVFRRGFLSELDHTIRPYSVYVPDDYDPQNEYPLLVYLHGSGQDDRALFNTDFPKEGFVVLAPNGRGTSNCYATSEAQVDIMEAIQDVRRQYSINDDRIILSGFSMGGYGVYRSFFEHPEVFSALAILSGHPDLASKSGMDGAPNFLDEGLLVDFYQVPIFIYHGEQDLNCPFELTERLVALLQTRNDHVQFITDEDAGHGSMGLEYKTVYFKWLQEMAR